MDPVRFFSRSVIHLRRSVAPSYLTRSPLTYSPAFRAFASRAMSTSSSIQEKLDILQNYSACDVSDALLKLQKPADGSPARAGHLADFTPFSPTLGRNTTTPKIIAPASTVKFIPKSASPSDYQEAKTELDPNKLFPTNHHWVDVAEPQTIVLIDQPLNQNCAVLGGIMALRMARLNVKGVIVNGRIRDLAEIQGASLPVWAKSTSTVGTGAEAKAGLRNVRVDVGGVSVEPGDIVFADPLEGVVVIPRHLLDSVLEVMPRLVEMDESVKTAVESGMSVKEAFGKFRG
ncbi:RraA family protein [Aspergillus undulatus]|uniref:RraA family protein n=1 Tax=Aspergillus undulatus TaxID=1810928 RepID=UPI003CCD470A